MLGQNEYSRGDRLKDIILWLLLPLTFIITGVSLCYDNSYGGWDNFFTLISAFINCGLLFFIWTIVIKFRDLVALGFTFILSIPMILIGTNNYFPLLYFVSTTLVIGFILGSYKLYNYCCDYY